MAGALNMSVPWREGNGVPNNLSDVLLVFAPKAGNAAQAGLKRTWADAGLHTLGVGGEGGEGAQAAQPEQSQPMQEPPAQAQWPPGSLVLHANKLVLCEASPRWSGRLSTTGSMAGDAATDPATGKAVLVERNIDPEYMEVAEALVRFLYTGQLGEAGAAPETGRLLALHRLADRLDVPGCRDACLGALVDLDPSQWSNRDVSEILCFLTPPSPRQQQQGGDQHGGDRSKHAPQLQAMCKGRLLQLFGDVGRLLDSNSAWKDFQRLCFPAVLLWAQSDELQVLQSENEVAKVVDWWQTFMITTDAEIEQLCAAIRVKHLSPSYRLYLFSTDWFRPMPSLMKFMSLQDRPKPSSLTDADLIRLCGMPRAWAAAQPRARLPAEEARKRRELVVSIPAESLASELDEALTRSKDIYIRGQRHDIGGHGVQLVVGLLPEDGRALLMAQLGRMDNHHPMDIIFRCRYSVSLGTAGAAGEGGHGQGGEAIAWQQVEECQYYFNHPNQRSWEVPLGPNGGLVSSMADLQPLLVDGSLWVKITVLEID